MRRFRQTRGYRMSVEARSLRRSPPSPRSPGRRDASISGKDDGTPATGSAHRLPSQNGVGRGPWRPSLTVDRRRRGGRLRGFRHSDGGRPGCRRRRITPATSRSSSPLAIYVQQTCLSVSAVVRPRWPRALVLGVLGASSSSGACWRSLRPLTRSAWWTFCGAASFTASSTAPCCRHFRGLSRGVRSAASRHHS
jgi:hypothetical protein